MPRPRDEEKRTAILRAATTVIAQRGLAATPTLAISREAGVAEGTLFTYFSTKQELANALYLHLKQQMAEAMFRGAPSQKTLRATMQLHWDGYVKWGVEHPEALRVMEQLASSGMLLPETIAAGNAPFGALERMVRSAIRSGELRRVPFSFLTGAFEAMAQTTIRQIQAGVGTSAQLRRLGFEMVWRAVTTETE